MQENNTILDQKTISWKIKRMAAELWEMHTAEEELILLGIESNGFVLAKNLEKELNSIAPIRIQVLSLSLNKKLPLQNEPVLEGEFTNKAIVLVDDVANSGKTLLYALKPILNFMPKSIHLAVLIDRSHKRFPIRPDVVGYSLSTTLQENVIVHTQGDIIIGAELS